MNFETKIKHNINHAIKISVAMSFNALFKYCNRFDLVIAELIQSVLSRIMLCSVTSLQRMYYFSPALWQSAYSLRYLRICVSRRLCLIDRRRRKSVSVVLLIWKACGRYMNQPSRLRCETVLRPVKLVERPAYRWHMRLLRTDLVALRNHFVGSERLFRWTFAGTSCGRSAAICCTDNSMERTAMNGAWRVDCSSQCGLS